MLFIYFINKVNKKYNYKYKYFLSKKYQRRTQYKSQYCCNSLHFYQKSINSRNPNAIKDSFPNKMKALVILVKVANTINEINLLFIFLFTMLKKMDRNLKKNNKKVKVTNWKNICLKAVIDNDEISGSAIGLWPKRINLMLLEFAAEISKDKTSDQIVSPPICNLSLVIEIVKNNIKINNWLENNLYEIWIASFFKYKYKIKARVNTSIGLKFLGISKRRETPNNT